MISLLPSGEKASTVSSWWLISSSSSWPVGLHVPEDHFSGAIDFEPPAGIELPNQKRETVFLREMFASPEYEKSRAPLTLALGKTIGGEPVMADLAKMPHLLIAGTTGSGKSVALNTMILSLLYRMPPEHCRASHHEVDPKMLELSGRMTIFRIF